MLKWKLKPRVKSDAPSHHIKRHQEIKNELPNEAVYAENEISLSNCFHKTCRGSRRSIESK